jgi:hypothetical protein
MQEGARHRRSGLASRCLAIGLAAMVVLVQLFALHHEAAVAHAQVARTGAYVHAQALGEYHQLSAASHLHSTDGAPHDDNGACTLLSALDHSTIAPDAFALFASAAPISHAISQQPIARAVVCTPLHAAPKTSPPALA